MPKTLIRRLGTHSYHFSDELQLAVAGVASTHLTISILIRCVLAICTGIITPIKHMFIRENLHKWKPIVSMKTIKLNSPINAPMVSQVARAECVFLGGPKMVAFAHLRPPKPRGFP